MVLGHGPATHSLSPELEMIMPYCSWSSSPVTGRPPSVPFPFEPDYTTLPHLKSPLAALLHRIRSLLSCAILFLPTQKNLSVTETTNEPPPESLLLFILSTVYFTVEKYSSVELRHENPRALLDNRSRLFSNTRVQIWPPFLPDEPESESSVHINSSCNGIENIAY